MCASGTAACVVRGGAYTCMSYEEEDTCALLALLPV
jgi:hypothetical protein